VTSSLEVDEYSDPKNGKYHFLSHKTSTVQQRRHQFEYETVKNAPGAVIDSNVTSDVSFRKFSKFKDSGHLSSSENLPQSEV
jgi:hypothetical protein